MAAAGLPADRRARVQQAGQELMDELFGIRDHVKEQNYINLCSQAQRLYRLAVSANRNQSADYYQRLGEVVATLREDLEAMNERAAQIRRQRNRLKRAIEFHNSKNKRHQVAIPAGCDSSDDSDSEMSEVEFEQMPQIN